MPTRRLPVPRSVLLLMALLLGGALATAGAQAPSVAAGPRLAGVRVGVQVMPAADAAGGRSHPQPAISRKRGVPQMIIGGAALVGGAIIGGDAGTLVMLGGLGYGLYGLYLYLQ